MKCSLLTLSCYVDAELEDRPRGEMEAHLVGCARCRSGLSHIREEVDRIGALARVRVVDESAHALLVQLGLIEPDDPLPERGEPTDDRSATLPPWLQGHAGAALPWTPERPARQTPAPRLPDDEPVELAGAPAAHRRLSALEGVPAVPFDLTGVAQDARAPLMPRTPEGPAAAEAPLAAALEAAVPEAAAMTEVPEVRRPLEWVPPQAPAPEAVTPPAPLPDADMPLAPPPEAALDTAPPAEGEPPAAPPLTEPPPPAQARRDPAIHDGHTWGLSRTTPLPRIPSPPVAPEPAATAPEDPPAAITADATAGEPGTATPAEDAADHSAPPLRGDSAVAVWTSDPAEAPPVADYPITDEDTLAEPLEVERFAPRGPAAAPRPRLVDRLRERLALRRAMGGQVDDDSADHGVEIVSGTGAPLHSRARSDLARRRAEALRPASAADLDESRQPRRERGAREMLPPSAHPGSQESVDPLSEQPAPPAAWRVRATPAAPTVDLRDVTGRPMMPRRPAGDTMPTGVPAQWGDPRPAPADDQPDNAAASTTASPARRRRELAPSTARGGRRSAIAYAAAIALIGAVGIISGRTTTHIPVPSTPGGTVGTAAAPAAPPANSQAGSSSASASSSASQPAAQAPAASVAPSAAPAPSAPTSLGSGGTGWSVQAIRIGDHGTYFRLVFDLGAATPGASGQPKVDLTYPDARTLVVTITGASASAAPPSVGSSAIVSAIAPGTAALAGSAVYRVTLSKPATGKPLYLTNPLRLVVDVSAS